MTLLHRKKKIAMARCCHNGCDHDLIVREDGFVICSRRVCKRHKFPHPTTSRLNRGKAAIGE